MIQRIQSIFLLITSCGFLGNFFTDFASSNISIPNLLADKVYEIQDNPILMGITILGSVISFAAIFIFNNRQLQSKLSIFSLILAIFLPLVAILLIYNEKTAIESGSEINDSLGAYLPILSILGSFLAIKYIGKDEKIVRSMDRLR